MDGLSERRERSEDMPHSGMVALEILEMMGEQWVARASLHKQRCPAARASCPRLHRTQAQQSPFASHYPYCRAFAPSLCLLAHLLPQESSTMAPKKAVGAPKKAAPAAGTAHASYQGALNHTTPATFVASWARGVSLGRRALLTVFIQI